MGGVFYTYKLRAFIVSFQKQFYSTRYWNGIWIKEYCGTDDMVEKKKKNNTKIHMIL